MRARKLLRRALDSPANLRFADFCRLVESFGFRLARVTGSHHIYLHPNVDEGINIQNVRGKAKPYQIRQALQLIERYNLQLKD